MNAKKLIWWGVLLVVGWLILRWLSNVVDSSRITNNGDDGAIYQGWPYAAPLTGPGYTRGWAAPWRGRGGGRGRGRGASGRAWVPGQ